MIIIIADFAPVSVESDTCIIVQCGDTMLPYIDLLTPTLGVALGGNGAAAKACDQLGKLAADLIVTGQWSSDIPRDNFRFIQKNDQAKL